MIENMKHELLQSKEHNLILRWRLLPFGILSYVIEFTKEETKDLKDYLNKDE